VQTQMHLLTYLQSINRLPVTGMQIGWLIILKNYLLMAPFCLQLHHSHTG